MVYGLWVMGYRVGKVPLTLRVSRNGEPHLQVIKEEVPLTLRVSRNDGAAPRWYMGKRRAAGGAFRCQIPFSAALLFPFLLLQRFVIPPRTQ